MELLALFWLIFTAPARFMPYLWPGFVAMSIFGGVMALMMRSVAFASTAPENLHPIMHSPVRWALLVAAGMFAMLWILIAVGFGALLWATANSGGG